MRKPWIKSQLRKPPQGKKVLCFNKGDIDIRQRFKQFWAPIPYCDAECANFEQPEFWQEIDFPEGYKGYMRVDTEKGFLTFDELEKEYPAMFEELVGEMIYTMCKGELRDR